MRSLKAKIGRPSLKSRMVELIAVREMNWIRSRASRFPPRNLLQIGVTTQFISLYIRGL